MSIDSLVWLFIGSFVSWVVLGLVYGFHAPRPARRQPAPPTVHIRVKVVPLAYRPPARMPDDFYEGCYRSLLNALDKEAKDNL